MKVLAVLLVAVCAASAAVALEKVKVERHGGNFAYSVDSVPHPYMPTPYAAHPYVAQQYAAQPYAAQPYAAQPFVAQPYVSPYSPYVSPVVAKEYEGNPVVSTHTAGAYPYPAGAYPYSYGYPYANAPSPYTYPYVAPYHTVPVVPKVEKV